MAFKHLAMADVFMPSPYICLMERESGKKHHEQDVPSGALVSGDGSQFGLVVDDFALEPAFAVGSPPILGRHSGYCVAEH